MKIHARPKWHERAACRGSSIDFTSPKKDDRAAALQVCGRCEVLGDCRAWALLDIDDNVAVLGGMDPAARKQFRKRQATGDT